MLCVCSGNPPDMSINATSSTPESPPPTYAANSHHTETMWTPISVVSSFARSSALAAPVDPTYGIEVRY